MPFITDKRIMGFKVEDPAYTAIANGAIEYAFKPFDIAYSPEVETVARKYATGDYSAFKSVVGKISMTCSFSVHLAWSGVAATPPEFADLLEACAMTETVHGSTGVSYKTTSVCSAPITIVIWESPCGAGSDGLYIKMKGAMGTVQIVMDAVGNPVTMNFEFQGVLNAMGDDTVPTVTGYDTTDPDPVLSSTITLDFENGSPVAQNIDSMTVDIGNTIAMYTDPADAYGFRGAYVVGREPTLELDPYLEPLATQDLASFWTGGVTGNFVMTVGDNITLSAPAFQITEAYSPADRDGIVTHTLSGILTRLDGNDDFEILQGSKT